MFWDVFVSLCADNGTSPNGVAKEIGASSGAVTFWKQGKIPHNATLLKIANYFGVTPDYLLGKEEKEKPTDVGELPEGERMWLEVYRKLSPQTRDTIARVLGAYDTLPPDLQGPVMELIISSLHKQ